jgi:REP element-mobilizing transposase RayT
MLESNSEIKMNIRKEEVVQILQTVMEQNHVHLHQQYYKQTDGVSMVLTIYGRKYHQNHITE